LAPRSPRSSAQRSAAGSTRISKPWRFQLGRLLHQSGVWELRLNRGRGSGAAYRRLSQAIGWVDQQVFELERYSAKVC
jgi:hypothetical protein